MRFTPTEKRKLLEAGLSKQYISALEQHLFQPSARKAEVIAKALGIGLRRALKINERQPDAQGAQP